MAIINTGLLTKGLRSEFFDRFDATTTYYQNLATRIQSTSDGETYKWLGSLPRMREWGTGRVAKGLGTESYSVENLKYESTLEVDRDEISDDKTGQIRIRIAELAQRAATHKDYLIAQLLINGEPPDVDLRGEYEFYDTTRRNSARMAWGIEDILDHEHLFMQAKRRAPSMRPHRVSGGLFLMSDNRSHYGEDSRSFGEVSPDTCVGTIFLRLMPGDGQSPTDHGPFARIE